jgi:Ser/Thr protein kinase RdoA (MazF antagonist)
MQESPSTIQEVVSHFLCTADIDSARAYGSGHINDSYFLKNSFSYESDYLLQRINHHVFPNVPALMDNMLLVTEHLEKKIRMSGKGDPSKEVMTLIPTDTGNYYYQNSEGSYWRMFVFLNDTRSYDQVRTEKQAYEGGRAFGKFQSMLSDIPPGKLFPVIPDFHNVQYRLAQLEEAIAQNAKGRLKEVAPELELVRHYETSMQYFQQPEIQAELPIRVTHNDTKFNNVLLDQNDEAQCVIDLETVMDGYVAYDFGDAIRTIINTAAEDEADRSKIQLNIPLFRAYTQGYLEAARSFLTEAEIRSLMHGVLLLPYMQSVRFLTDYLNGDTYYKTQFEGHNLQRARAQFQLVTRLDTQRAEVEAIIREGIQSYKAV